MHSPLASVGRLAPCALTTDRCKGFHPNASGRLVCCAIFGWTRGRLTPSFVSLCGKSTQDKRKVALTESLRLSCNVSCPCTLSSHLAAWLSSQCAPARYSKARWPSQGWGRLEVESRMRTSSLCRKRAKRRTVTHLSSAYYTQM